jgi:hypothetical protein
MLTQHNPVFRARRDYAHRSSCLILAEGRHRVAALNPRYSPQSST